MGEIRIIIYHAIVTADGSKLSLLVIVLRFQEKPTGILRHKRTKNLIVLINLHFKQDLAYQRIVR